MKKISTIKISDELKWNVMLVDFHDQQEARQPASSPVVRHQTRLQKLKWKSK